MIPKPRSFRVPRNPIGLLILLAAFAAAGGCSDANTSGDGGVNHVDASGNSVPGWVTPTGGTHANSATMNYIANGGSSSCTECHGSDLGGGISRVSCFANTANCHHGTIAGWVAVPPAAQNHGVSAKKAPGSSGFASCQICHGNNFTGANIAPTCLNNATCHGAGVASPHAHKPWRGAPYTHTDTDPANAPVCAKCHFLGSQNNPANHPATPAPAGTAPGCFNNTLCHGANPVPHPLDNAWAPAPPAAQPHGNDAKAALGATTGFAYCQECHGTTGANFAGGSSGVSCTNNPDAACHGSTVASPHAPKPWRASAGSPYTHTTTVEAGNAPVCAQCHFPNSPNNPPGHPATPAPAGTAPGCFNSTLCHGSTFHLPGWDQATQHGPVAKQAPSTSSGFAFCQLCHGTGTDFSGGSVGFSCYPCHGDVGTPHPSQWLPGDTFVHTTTAGGNATVCDFCHRNGTNSPIPPPNPPAPDNTAPGCFNSTLCHNGGGGGAPHPVPFDTTAHYSVDNTAFTANCGTCHAVTGTSPVSAAPLCTTCHTAGSPLTALSCTSCHANPPGGATTEYPNVAGAHDKHLALAPLGNPITCDTCHSGYGTGTAEHYKRAYNRVGGVYPVRTEPGDVAFLATYYAASGASAFDNAMVALSCSNVSCHGGQDTPNWQTGALNVNTQCTSCHVFGTSLGNPQYNSPYSGRHDINSSHRTCTNCHNTTTLAVNHFTALGTTAMEGPASATIGGTGTLVTTYVPATQSCTPTCHGTRTW